WGRRPSGFRSGEAPRTRRAPAQDLPPMRQARGLAAVAPRRAPSAEASDLDSGHVLPVHVAETTLVPQLEITDALRTLADEGAAVGVDGDLVDARDDLMQIHGIVDVAPLRTVTHQHACGIHYRERRPHEGREI